MTSLDGAISYAARVVILSVSLAGTCNAAGIRDGWSAAEAATITSMRLAEAGERPADPSNAYEHLPAAAKLGKQLFQDTGLSSNSQVACASCHLPGEQFQDGRPRGQGVGAGRRRTMPVMGAAHSPFLFWDGRKDSLWSQALGPLEDGLEHGSNRVALVRLVRTHYQNAYEQVFGAMPEFGTLPEGASPNGTDAERAAWAGLTDTQRERVNRVFASMGKAIAAYERNISYGESRFDRYAEAIAAGKRGEHQILTAQEIRGLRLFLNQGQCSTCHNGPLLTDHAFHNTGVPPVDATAPDAGRAVGVLKLQQDEFNCLGRYSDARPGQCTELQFLAIEDPTQVGAFRTPSLRNVAARAPYMHAGQFPTLDRVIEHYARSPAAIIGHSELARPGEDNAIRRVIRLSPAEIRDIGAFLETLTGPSVDLAGIDCDSTFQPQCTPAP
ncbi:MAG: cytochrome c peroxidase [Steroidobacteraceae bacterium]